MQPFRIECLPTDTLLTILEKTTPSDLCKIRQTSSQMDSFMEQYRHHLARKRRDNVVLGLEVTEERLTMKANKKVLHSPVQQLSAMHVKSINIKKFKYPGSESVLLQLFQTLSAIFSAESAEGYEVWAKTPMCGILNFVGKEVVASFCFDFSGDNTSRMIEELHAVDHLPLLREFSIENLYYDATLDKRFSVIWTLSPSYFDGYVKVRIAKNPEKVFALELPSKTHLLIAFSYLYDMEATMKRHPQFEEMEEYFQQTVIMMITKKNPTAIKAVMQLLPFSDTSFRQHILESIMNRFV